MSRKPISLARPEFPEALRRTIAADIEAILGIRPAHVRSVGRSSSKSALRR